MVKEIKLKKLQIRPRKLLKELMSQRRLSIELLGKNQISIPIKISTPTVKWPKAP